MLLTRCHLQEVTLEHYRKACEAKPIIPNVTSRQYLATWPSTREILQRIDVSFGNCALKLAFLREIRWVCLDTMYVAEE